MFFSKIDQKLQSSFNLLIAMLLSFLRCYDESNSFGAITINLKIFLTINCSALIKHDKFVGMMKLQSPLIQLLTALKT